MLTKRRYDSEKVKKEIMESALLLFSQNGYNQTSVADLSKASGYSKGHIYYHFQNKEKLFVLLARKTIEEWHEKWIRKAAAYSSATEKLYGMARHVLYNYQTPLLKSGQELASNPDSSADLVKELYDLSIVPKNAYRAVLQEGMDNGEFAIENMDESAILLEAWLRGLCQLTSIQELSELEPLLNEAITIFLRSIRKGDI